MYYVYQLRVEDRELPFYVGKGIAERATRHFRDSYLNSDSNRLKANTILKARKEGKEVLIEYIETGLTESDAFTLERFYIQLYGRRDQGTGCLANLTDGGEGHSGYINSEETRKRKSLAKLNGKRGEEHHMWGRKLSDEVKDKLSEVKTGELNPMYGRTQSEGTKRKIAESKKGKRMPTTTCPHCGKVGSVPNMGRYHFDNCKQRKNI